MSQQSLFWLRAIVIHVTSYSTTKAVSKELIENEDVLGGSSDGQRCETLHADPATTTVEGFPAEQGGGERSLSQADARAVQDAWVFTTGDST